MGDRLTEESRTEPRSYGDIFDEAFPHYLLMGMTPEQFWDGESELKIGFRKAYRIRLENEERIRDQNAWLIGRYIQEAIHSVPVIVAGWAPKNARPGDYPAKPYSEKLAEQKKAEKRKRNEEEQMKLAMALFAEGVKKFNKNFTKRQEHKAVST